MKKCYVILVALALLLLAQVSLAVPFLDEENADDYNDNLDRLLQTAEKRSCIKRGVSCDHRPNDCCYNSSCRCNLWGTNCRCERMGLFQQWGK